MLNLADFSVLLMLLVGPLTGFAAALAYKASTASAILFAFMGIAVGLGVGRLIHKYAYAVLNSKKISEAMKFFIYSLIPILGLLTVVGGTIILAWAYYG